MPASTPVLDARVAHQAFSVSLDGLGRAFTPGKGASRPVLRDLTLEIEPREIVAILGTSGCGKSTLLRIVAGLDTPTAGAVRINGTPVTSYDPRCAVGFQEPRLLPWRTIAANVALGLPRNTPTAVGRKTVATLLEKIGPIFVDLGDVPNQQQVDDALGSIVNDSFVKQADPARVQHAS